MLKQGICYLYNFTTRISRLFVYISRIKNIKKCYDHFYNWPASLVSIFCISFSLHNVI